MSTLAAVAHDDDWLAWPLRPLRSYRGSPLALGAAIIVGYALLAALWYLAVGAFESPPAGFEANLGLDLLYAVTLGYSPVALLYVRRGTERELARLAPVLGSPVEATRRQVFAASPWAFWIGIAVALSLFGADLWIGWASGTIDASAGMWAWFILRELVCDVAFMSVVAWLVAVATRMSQLAPAPERIRLLATAELSPFAQHGVRLALFTLLYWAIWVPSIFFMGEGIARPIAAILASGMVFSGISLWLPTRAIRANVHAAKQTELAQVRRSIEQARSAALDASRGDSDAAATRLTGLLAYEQRIADVSESLIDARTLGRVAIYLLIPLASWIGGALVERVVDAALE